jgi:hypothetical protein
MAAMVMTAPAGRLGVGGERRGGAGLGEVSPRPRVGSARGCARGWEGGARDSAAGMGVLVGVVRVR